MSSSIIRTIASIQQPKLLQKASVAGVIESKVDTNQFSVKTAAGTLIIHAETDQLAPGDAVTITQQNGKYRLEKAGVKIDNVTIDKDSFKKGDLSKGTSADLLESLKQSITSDDSDLNAENVTAAIDIIKNRGTLAGVDKNQIVAVMKAIENRIAQGGTISQSTVDALQKLYSVLQDIVQNKPEKDAASLALLTTLNLKNGIHAFTSTDEFLDLLDDTTDLQALKKQLSSMLDTSGTINARISGDSQNRIAALLLPENTSRELQTIVSNMKSSLMQSLPKESLEILLNIKGVIDTEVLDKIDNMFAGLSSRFQTERAGNRGAAVATITNWLTTAVDTIDSSAQSAPRMLPALPQTLISDITGIDTLLSKSQSVNQMRLAETGITENLLHSESRDSVIPKSFSNLGFDTEAHILKTGTLQNGLKSELLKLHAELSTDTEPQVVPNGNVVAKIDNTFRELVAFVNGLDKQTTTTPESVSKISDLLTNLKTQISSLKNIPGLDDITAELDKLITTLQTSKTLSPELISTIREKAGSLAELFANRISAVSQDSSTLHKGTAEPDTHQQSRTPGDTDPVNLELQQKIRTAVESTVNRLESLQLLARQTPVTDGHQQILALPMKIGDEWTEVNIRFLKKDKEAKKKRTDSSTFTVNINLAPVNLGAVSVKMDYVIKKSLRISMDIEKDSTRDFFKKCNNEIKNAIAQLGLPVFSLDIKKISEKTAPVAEKILEQLIDVKV